MRDKSFAGGSHHFNVSISTGTSARLKPLDSPLKARGNDDPRLSWVVVTLKLLRSYASVP